MTPNGTPETLEAAAAAEQTPPPSPDFRVFLQNELMRRCRVNPRYSLRAFARYLEIEPSALSKLLHGKRAFSTNTIQRLGRRLGLDTADLERMSSQREKKLPRPDDYETLALDHFRIISDWYHYAILELTRTKGFKADTKGVARVLGISVPEVNTAVERLVRLGMLEITPEGTWIDRAEFVTTIGHAFTNVGFRNLQRQILAKAIHALDEIPLERRHQSSMTMAIDSSRLPEAVERIKKFRRDLCKYLEAGENVDSVYNLTISLYPLTTEGELQ